MKQLSISATAHALNYLPQYHADHVGLFAAHDLTVISRACDPWTGVLDDLDSGVADVALGGLWVPAMYAGSQRDLVAFAQVNDRFPKALVVRGNAATFTWSSLVDGTILAPGIGGSAPYAVTAGLLREHGVDPSSVAFLRDLSTPMYVELFESGLGDAIVLDTLTAQSMVDRGTGVIAVDYTSAVGVGPNSVYYCHRDRIDELRDRLTAFVTALDYAMREVCATPVAGLRPLLTQHWPTAGPSTLSAACVAIQESGTWDSVRIDPEGTRRWMEVLAAERMVSTAPTFDQIVTPSITAHLELSQSHR